MSSYPDHEENVLALKDMGFDVSNVMEGDKVIFESWGYDEQVDLYSDVIATLQRQNFKVQPDK